MAGGQPREAMCDSDSSCQVGLVCTGSTYTFCLQQCVVGDSNRACRPGRGRQTLPGGPKVGDELIGSCVPMLTCDPAGQSTCPAGESCSLFRRFGPEAVCAKKRTSCVSCQPWQAVGIGAHDGGGSAGNWEKLGRAASYTCSVSTTRLSHFSDRGGVICSQFR